MESEKEVSHSACGKGTEITSCLPSWVYPVEVLQPYLGSQGEQHILAATSRKQQQQQQAGGEKVLLWTLCLKSGMQVAQNNRRANAHHHNEVLSYFEPSSLFYGRFSCQKWPFLGCFQGDRPENSGRSPLCQVGVFNEGRSSSITIGPSKECKWVGNKACAMPWCLAVADFEVKMSRF